MWFLLVISGSTVFRPETNNNLTSLQHPLTYYQIAELSEGERIHLFIYQCGISFKSRETMCGWLTSSSSLPCPTTVTAGTYMLSRRVIGARVVSEKRFQLPQWRKVQF